MQNILYLFTTFILFSFLGWSMEEILTFIKEKKFVNRGFLLGPYCPIYGIGVLIYLLIINKYGDDLLVLFLMGTAMCSTLEYLTSYFLEKIFKARWWDYSHLPFNVNGRICLTNSILFGLGGILVLYVQPIFNNLIESIPLVIFNPTILLIIVWFIIDCFISLNIMSKLKNATFSLYKDNTEEITKKISTLLREGTIEFSRLAKAFPNAYFFIKKKLK